MILLVGEVYSSSLENLPFPIFKTKNLNSIPEKIKKEVKIIVSRWTQYKYNYSILKQFPKLEYLLLAQIWTDNVNHQDLKKLWITLKNFISNYAIESVAELVTGMILLWIKHWFYLWNLLKNWFYARNHLWQNISNINIWLIWFGRIWQKIASILKNFNTTLLAYDIIFQDLKTTDIVLEDKYKIKICKNIHSLLEKSNIICVQIPKNWNENLLNKDNLKNIIWIINISRPGIINEKDILFLLENGKLQFYASDVINWEPNIEKINTQLLKHPKVFITPHIWANSLEAQIDISNQIANFIKNIYIN